MRLLHSGFELKSFPSDILRELATFGESPVRNPQTPIQSHKRDREEIQDSLPTPPMSEGRSPEEDNARPRKPIPRGKQATQSQNGNGQTPDLTSPSTTSPIRNYPRPPTIPSNLMARGPQWIGPTGGVTISPTQSVQPYPNDLSPDGHTPSGSSGDNMIPNFFDAALFGAALGGNTNGVMGPPAAALTTSSSTSSLGSLAGNAPVPNWEGILSQQQNPYGSGFGAPGIDFFNPYVGYQGPGGPLGFAAEAQAFLGNEDGVNWPDALNFGCATLCRRISYYQF